MTGAARKLRDAEEWRSTWPQAWARAVAYVEHEAHAGRKCTMRAAFASLRGKDFTGEHGERFRGVNNNILPALCRMLAAERPDLAPYLATRTRRADVDLLAPPGGVSDG